MPKRSIFTDIVLEVVDEAKRYRKDAEKSNVVPFMMESLRPHDAENRLRKMPAKERIKLFPTQPKSVRSCMIREMSRKDIKELINSVGPNAIIDSVKGDV
jgi:Mg/Co/Ni transporter MgtE